MRKSSNVDVIDIVVLVAVILAVMVLTGAITIQWPQQQQTQPTVLQPIVIQAPQMPTAVAPIQPETAVNGLVLDVIPAAQPQPTPAPAVQIEAVQPQPTLTNEFAAACEAAKASGRRKSPKCRDVMNGAGR